jgi:hypothetical protein
MRFEVGASAPPLYFLISTPSAADLSLSLTTLSATPPDAYLSSAAPCVP